MKLQDNSFVSYDLGAVESCALSYFWVLTMCKILEKYSGLIAIVLRMSIVLLLLFKTNLLSIFKCLTRRFDILWSFAKLIPFLSSWSFELPSYSFVWLWRQEDHLDGNGWSIVVTFLFDACREYYYWLIFLGCCLYFLWFLLFLLKMEDQCRSDALYTWLLVDISWKYLTGSFQRADIDKI